MDPADNMKGAEDILLVVLHSHVVAAANVILSDKDHPIDIRSVSRSMYIVEPFVRILLPSATSPVPVKATDKVCMYSMEVLTLGLWWYNFYDSIMEGDGDRLIHNWN